MSFPEDKIRDVLRSVGWEDERIDGGFKAAELFTMTSSPAIALELPKIKVHRTLRGDLEEIKRKKVETQEQRLKVTVTMPISFKGDVKRQTLDKTGFVTAKRLTNGTQNLLLPRPNLETVLFGMLDAAPKSVPLLLSSPRQSIIWWHKIRGVIDYFFVSFENAVMIIGRALVMPIVFVGMILSVLVKAVTVTMPVSFKGDVKRQTLDKTGFVTAKRLTNNIQFPEHILLRDIFRLAARMFKTRRLRTFLTILGISVGIGTILFLISLGYGMQNVLFEKITTEEALLTLDALPPVDSSVIAINDKLIEKIKAIHGVAEVSAMSSLNGTAIWKESSAAGFVYLANPSYLRLSGLKPFIGRLPGENEKNYTIISSAMVQAFNLDQPKNILNEKINFTVLLENEQGITSVNLDGNFEIIGIIDDPFSIYTYIPIPDSANFKLSEYSQLKVKVSDAQFLEPVRETILTEGLLVSALSETVDQAKKVFNIARLILGLFGIITLVVSAIGMLNTMTIALLERTQEVGIMKAVGASNLDIWKLFLAEAMIMGFFGGIGGIAIGYLSAAIFNFGINVLAKAFGGQALTFFQTPSWFVFTIVSFSVIIGMITGFWPARRASRLDPLEALKYK